MMKKKFIDELENLSQLIRNRPKQEDDARKRPYDFSVQRSGLYKKDIESSVRRIRDQAFGLAALYRDDTANKEAILGILALVDRDLASDPAVLKQLSALARSLREKPRPGGLSIAIPKNIPAEIRPDVSSDLRELEKAYNSGCFRASAILCGRVLETCLHRKYYEATGKDILEKNPGIGLGKLIAKLSEKDVRFDPGLTQQIHLINQVRISSVHVKRESFYPSAQQSYAMILYTADIIGKMF